MRYVIENSVRHPRPSEDVRRLEERAIHADDPVTLMRGADSEDAPHWQGPRSALQQNCRLPALPLSLKRPKKGIC